MSTFKSIALTSVLLLAAKVQAQISIPVSDVTLAFAPSNLYRINLKLDGIALFDPTNGNTRTAIADPFKIASDPSHITGISDATIRSTALWFCLDPLQTIFYSGHGSGDLNYRSGNSAQFNVFSDNGISNTQLNKGGGLTAGEATDIANLFARNFVAALSSNLMASALQIAIWEVVNENSPGFSTHSYNLSSGNFSVTNTSTTASNLIWTAQNMLNTRTSAPVTSSGSLDFLIDGTYNATCPTILIQDMVGWEAPIPESSNFAVGALGLLGAAVVLKLRTRKSKVIAA